MEKDINNKDLVTWGLMIAALYFLSKNADCSCNDGSCSLSNPIATNMQSPAFVGQLASGVDVL